MASNSDRFTEPPWFADVAGIVYAIQGRAGQTTVAKLKRSAPAELLAAAPDLLETLEAATECLTRHMPQLRTGPLGPDALRAKDQAESAIHQAKNGLADLTGGREWEVPVELPPPERRANARLLGAASDLREAARSVRAIVATLADCAGVSDALNSVIRRTNG